MICYPAPSLFFRVYFEFKTETVSETLKMSVFLYMPKKDVANKWRKFLIGTESNSWFCVNKSNTSAIRAWIGLLSILRPF